MSRLCYVSLVGLAIGCGSPERVAAVAPQPPAEPSATMPANAASPKAGAIKQLAVAGANDDAEWGIRGVPVSRGPSYEEVVRRVAAMVGDSEVRRGASRRGLVVQNVNWEDTGRATGSSLGPNISDLTLQVRQPSEGRRSSASTLMPVIRFPNFADRTGDVPVDRFFVRVGNERSGGGLRTVTLTEVLSNLAGFASMPESLRGSRSLLAPRDTHFLVSAQAVFLPIPTKGKAEFNPVLFNYQSAPGSPAVLTLLVTRQGTSMTVIENRAEERSGAVGSGQELYFNAGGQRTALTAERKGEVTARIAAQGGPKTEDDRSALAKGADVLFLIQVPLVHANRGVLGGMMPSPASAMSKATKSSEAAAPPSMAAGPGASVAARERSDVEQAVLGHGARLGPFNEGRGLRLVRDQSLPVRITVQFYKATSNGIVSEADLDGIAKSIGDVYEHADFVGSLVVPEGDPRRPTAWQTMPGEWFPW
jgi:hypothetical protein